MKTETPAYQISITLDKRRLNKNGKYPVRLQVFTLTPRVQKRYATIFECTVKEFTNVWLTTKPLNKYKPLRDEIQALQVKANAVAKELNPFTFEEFEKRMYRKADSGISVRYQYSETYTELMRYNRVGTANVCKQSEKSIITFLESTQVKQYDKLTLYDITVKWLMDYEQYMTDDEGKSYTTVGIYLRALRTVFNNAIEAGEIERQFYPFGKRKYQIPAGRNTKKALSQEQLSKLFHAEPMIHEQEKAKDFWFFSYSCNGMNVKDIALLRYKNIQDGKVEYFRAKTRNTSKANLAPITVYLNDYATGVIEKYKNPNTGPETLLFDIIRDDMTPQEQQSRVGNFTRFINQHIKKLCKANDLPEQLSTYWARHSFATTSIRKGASMEFMQESLGHCNLKKTQNYFAGFDDESKKEFAQRIMDFD